MSLNKKPSIGDPSFGTAPVNKVFDPFTGGGLSPEIREYIDQRIQDHQHNGMEASRTDIDAVQGLFETVSSVPNGIPNDMYDQIKIYKNGATYRLYWYEGATNTWRYATGT